MLYLGVSIALNGISQITSRFITDFILPETSPQAFMFSAPYGGPRIEVRIEMVDASV
jgi:hypothetical protein